MITRPRPNRPIGEPKVFRPFHMLPPETVFEIAGNLTLGEANQMRLGNKMLRDNVLPTNDMSDTQNMFKDERINLLTEMLNLEDRAESYPIGSLQKRLLYGESRRAFNQKESLRQGYRNVPLKDPSIDHLPGNPFRKNR